MLSAIVVYDNKNPFLSEFKLLHQIVADANKMYDN